MSDTYYQYSDVKVMMAEKLMTMDGWNVYGYSPDRSDSMTDYYNPAGWGGIAEKNGYILCVDIGRASEPVEIREYDQNSQKLSRDVADKISKLERMTVERGASEAEELSAKRMISKLQDKEAENDAKSYVVTGIIPGHMENPPRMNWHIEKDGLYVEKGNGILKYANVYNYHRYPHYKKGMEAYREDKEKYKKDIVNRYMAQQNVSEQRAAEYAKSKVEEMEKVSKLLEQFDEFINKIDVTCGGMIGDGETVTYEKVIVTEYKKQNVVKETENGCIKDGQCFILKVPFNYGCNKGLVYRIHLCEVDGRDPYYYANKLNGKKTKECVGRASRNNYWYIGTASNEKFLRWIEKGAIAWCEICEEKVPYKVEKVVKKKMPADGGTTAKTMKKQEAANTDQPAEETTEEQQTSSIAVNDHTYLVSEDTDTRTGDKIYLVRVQENLSREEYIKVNQYIRSLGGYYSRFKHAFLFREDPSGKFAKNNDGEESAEKQSTEETESMGTNGIAPEQPEQKITFTVTEDVHAETGEHLFVVTPDAELSKSDFADVKRRFAVMHGFYSSFKRGFIFQYDPSEKLA